MFPFWGRRYLFPPPNGWRQRHVPLNCLRKKATDRALRDSLTYSGSTFAKWEIFSVEITVDKDRNEMSTVSLSFVVCTKKDFNFALMLSKSLIWFRTIFDSAAKQFKKNGKGKIMEKLRGNCHKYTENVAGKKCHSHPLHDALYTKRGLN